MALHTLISTQSPRDFLGIVGFSEVAREIKPEELPTVSWDYVYGTNMQHGLILSRRMLAHRHGTKQIIMITDGEPTAHLVPNGEGGHEVSFNYPPIAETVKRTLSEVRPLHPGRHHHQHLHARSRPLAPGVRRADVETQPGEGVLHNPENLGDYVLVDFLEHRRTKHTRSAGGSEQRSSSFGSGRGSRSGSDTGPWRSRPGPGMWGTRG